MSPENVLPPFEVYCLAHLRVELFRAQESPHADGYEYEDEALALSSRLVDAAIQANRVGIALQALCCARSCMLRVGTASLP